MPQLSRRICLVLGALAALTPVACSGGGSDRAAADSGAAGQDSAMGDNTAEADDRWNYTAGDVDAWVRGMEGGLDSMRIASRQIQAMTGRARIDAYSKMIPVVFVGVEARAAKLDPDRYTEISSNLHDAYNALTGGADSSTSAEILRHLRPDARTAVERHLPRVRAIYAEQTKLTAQAGGFDSLLTKP